MTDETTVYLESLLHDRGMAYTRTKRNEREKLRAEMQALVKLIRLKEHNEMELDNLTNEQKGKLLDALLSDDIELAKSLMAEREQPARQTQEALRLNDLTAEYKQKMMAARGNRRAGHAVKEQYRQMGVNVDRVHFEV